MSKATFYMVALFFSALLLAAAGLALTPSGRNFIADTAYPWNPLLRACEAKLADELASPSSYRRISFEHKRIAQDADKLGRLLDWWKIPEAEKTAIVAAALKGQLYSLFGVVIVFDVQNEFGALVREKRVCGVVAQDNGVWPDNFTNLYLGKNLR